MRNSDSSQVGRLPTKLREGQFISELLRQYILEACPCMMLGAYNNKGGTATEAIRLFGFTPVMQQQAASRRQFPRI